MLYNVYGVFYSQYPHQHVSAAIAAILNVMWLLQQHKGTNMVSCVAVTTYQLKKYYNFSWNHI